jgi:hypothetical protein
VRLETQVQLEAATLLPGTSKRIQCPVCRAPLRTFSITREPSGTLLWNCYRNACRAGGASGYLNIDNTAAIPKPRDTAYRKPYFSVALSDLAYFKERFGISHQWSTGIKRTEDSCYLLPMLLPTGERRGWVRRTPTWTGTPSAPLLAEYKPTGEAKTINYPDNEGDVPLSWYAPDSVLVPEAILVEDMCSAMRIASAGHLAVALLGGSLSDARVREIQQAGIKHVVWAPDPDAIGIALKHSGKYSSAFDTVRVRFLSCDPKDYDSTADLLTDLGVRE